MTERVNPDERPAAGADTPADDNHTQEPAPDELEREPDYSPEDEGLKDIKGG